MWWDEAQREWRRHPDCVCHRDPCVCRYLRPLDQFGVPQPYPIMDVLRESLKTRTGLLGYCKECGASYESPVVTEGICRLCQDTVAPVSAGDSDE